MSPDLFRGSRRSGSSLLGRNGSGESEDPGVALALKEYLAALENGDRPNRREFLARHADVADKLGDGLDNLEFLQAALGRLHRPSEDDVHGDSGTLPPGPLGDFRIGPVIGRGGMGVVYEAEQLSLNRRVALKVLPFAAALDPRQLQRFKSEAQAAAQLHHTNIVPIYAVGCERGVHYYAMQYIEGRSLAAVIKELRQAAAATSIPAPARSAADLLPGPQVPGSTRAQGGEGPGTSAAPPSPGAATSRCSMSEEHSARDPRFYRRVARLGMKAAEALDHAHQFGVVHRDVKPANLLLDVAGNLWVTDFGLALFHTSAGLTVTGEVVGTLRYMSPEQALARRGVVDHRTDVYSLGATLYELLTLQPLFDACDRQDLMHRIAFEEPCAPRQIDRRIPGELETILLKALAKDPAERYATAQDLADDLQRFLQDRPVLARRPTLWQTLRKWGWRHRSLVATGAGTLGLLLIGSLVSTALIAREHFATRKAYERERRESLEAQEQRARAEKSFQRARRAVDFFTRLGEEELPNTPALNGVRRRMLEGALAYYQEFIDQTGAEPSLQSELAGSHQRVKNILGELTALEDAGQLRLLGERNVEDDLELTQAQRQKIKALADELSGHCRESCRNLGELGQEERRRRIIDFARSAEADLAQMLTPEQTHRLRQLILQVQAPHSFTTPEVVEVLQLTSSQHEHIRGILDDLALARWNCIPCDCEHVAARRKIDELRRNASDQVLRGLTVEQRAAWRNLTGAPLCSADQ